MHCANVGHTPRQRDHGWQAHDLGPSARLTLEDLSRPLSQHSVLAVEIESYGLVVQGLYAGTNHLTAIVNGRVHDLSRMGANGYARTERVKNVFGAPRQGHEPSASATDEFPSISHWQPLRLTGEMRV